VLEKAMISNYFDIYLSNEDVENPKPNPEIYNKCIQNLGVLPCETLILEDNVHGKKAAIESGAHLLEINTINEVTYFNIKSKIQEIIKLNHA
jgi:HAD superfamily hydrolase (TIGR01509 family)